MKKVMLWLWVAWVLAGCNSQDPLGFVARANRDVEIARIQAQHQDAMALLGFGLVVVGVILAVALIRSNERIRIAEIEAQRAQMEDQRRFAPTPMRYALADPDDEWRDWDAEEAEWSEVSQGRISQRSTVLARRL